MLKIVFVDVGFNQTLNLNPKPQRLYRSMPFWFSGIGYCGGRLQEGPGVWFRVLGTLWLGAHLAASGPSIMDPAVEKIYRGPCLLDLQFLLHGDTFSERAKAEP